MKKIYVMPVIIIALSLIALFVLQPQQNPTNNEAKSKSAQTANQPHQNLTSTLVMKETVQTTKHSLLTILPQNFDKCVEVGGYVANYNSYVKDTSCTFHVASNENPELFAECEKVGGGIVVVEAGLEPSSPGFYICKIIYPKSGPPCYSNYCD